MQDVHNKSTDEVLINKERSAAFWKAKKSYDSLPPTQDALHLHIKQANYQTMIWRKAVEPCPTLPAPEESGWHYEENILKPQLLTQNKYQQPACN